MRVGGVITRMPIRLRVRRRLKYVSASLWTNTACPSFRGGRVAQGWAGRKCLRTRRAVGTAVPVGVGVGVRVTVGVGVGVGEPGGGGAAGKRYAPISHCWPVLYWSPVRTLFGHEDPGRRAVL